MTDSRHNYDPGAVSGYLDAVASPAPTPGGGSVAAIVGALGAALGEMVCNLSIGRAGVEDPEDALSSSLANLASARADLFRLAAEDELAYTAYLAAAGLPKATAEEKEARRAAMQEVLLGAAAVPLATARAAGGLFAELETVARLGNPHVLSDAVVAAILAEAAVRSAGVNVRVNTGLLKDRAAAEDLDCQIDAIESEARAAAEQVRLVAAERT